MGVVVVAGNGVLVQVDEVFGIAATANALKKVSVSRVYVDEHLIRSPDTLKNHI